jgi:hexosaminidase
MMMNRILLIVFFCHAAAAAFSQPDSLLIPEPVEIKRDKGYFGINGQTRILTDNDTVRQIAILFAEQMNPVVGKNLKTENAGAKKGNITLELNNVADPEIGSEGYRLYIRPSGICISSNQPAGIFYGLQSLGQMMELAAAKAGKQKIIRVPAVSVVDYPRFAWRGLMLDVSRHFFSKEFILEYLDQMAKYKFNVFHWHLTDDPGWRMEIKRYPKLTAVGAWSVPRTGMFYSMPAPQPGEKATYGGYYSQDDIREIVAYAASLQITVVPEIDIPGHSRALLAAYPHASCSRKPISVYAGEAGGPD